MAVSEYRPGEGGFYTVHRGRRHGFFRHLPVVIVPWGYSYTAPYDDSHVIQIDPQTRTASSTEHAVTIEPERPAAPPTPRTPVSPKVFEVQPEGSGDEAQVEEMEEVEEQEPAGESIEVLRGGTAPLEGDEAAVLYLIALNNGVIHTSREHWIEGGVLHYVTAQNIQRQVNLGEVDLDLTARLNAERNLEFSLPVRPNRPVKEPPASVEP